MVITSKRVQSHVLEKVIGVLMIIFGIAAVYVFITATSTGFVLAEVADILISLIIVLAILAQTVILIRIYELSLK